VSGQLGIVIWSGLGALRPALKASMNALPDHAALKLGKGTADLKMRRVGHFASGRSIKQQTNNKQQAKLTPSGSAIKRGCCAGGVSSKSGGGAGVKLEFRRIVVWPGGREEIQNVSPKALSSPSHALPGPTDPTDDTNEGAV
jgi:hypothetical protein